MAENEDRRKFFNNAQNNLERLRNFINDLLDMASVEAGRLKLKLGLYDINEVARSVVGFLDRWAKAKNIRQLNKDIPVVLITAYTSDVKITEAEKYGISGLFYKYKDLSESTNLIETILRRHKGLKQQEGLNSI